MRLMLIDDDDTILEDYRLESLLSDDAKQRLRGGLDAVAEHYGCRPPKSEPRTEAQQCQISEENPDD